MVQSPPSSMRPKNSIASAVAVRILTLKPRDPCTENTGQLQLDAAPRSAYAPGWRKSEQKKLNNISGLCNLRASTRRLRDG
jgi:hypothetical protein